MARKYGIKQRGDIIDLIRSNYFVNLNYNGNKEARSLSILSRERAYGTLYILKGRQMCTSQSGSGDLIVTPYVLHESGPISESVADSVNFR